MTLKRRLECLENRQGSRRVHIPWSVDDPFAEGVEVDGRFYTWDEFEQAYPGGPWPISWNTYTQRYDEHQNTPQAA